MPIFYISAGLVLLVIGSVTIILKLVFSFVRAFAHGIHMGSKSLPNAVVERVVDGDTIVVHGHRYRIAYMDAPEHGQFTLDLRHQAGDMATVGLKSALKPGERVRLDAIDVDVYGRTVAIVWLGRENVGLSMVEAGLAIALPDAPYRYHEAERHARDNRIGLWGLGGFETPKLWREAHPYADSSALTA